MTLTMLNELLLPIFLFILYFSIGSIFIHEASPKIQKVPTLQDYADAFDDMEEIDLESILSIPETHETQEDNNKDSDEISIDDPEPENTSTPSGDSSLQTQINNLVENMKLGAMINNLKSPQLRKLCRPLGIQQKRNGITLSTQLMRAEIQRQYYFPLLEACLTNEAIIVHVSVSAPCLTVWL